jgi:flagellin
VEIDTEYQELVDEIDRLSGSTTFNARELLAGTASTVDFQVGIDTTSDDGLSVGFGGVSASGLGVGSTLLTGTDATNANAAITALDTALDTMGSKRARFGAAVSRLGFALSNGQGMRSNLEASVAAIREVDLAEETTMTARYQILLEAGAAALASAQGIRSQIVRGLLGIER